MILPFICRKPIVLSFRSSHRRCSLKKGVLKNFAKVTGKHLWQSLFFNKGVFAQVFSCEFCQLFKKTFLQNTSRRLLRKHIENCYIKRHHVYFNLLWLFWISLSMNIFFLIIVSFIIVTRHAKTLHEHNKL